MPKTPFTEAVRRVLNVLNFGEPLNVSKVARGAEINWKTADKVLKFLVDTTETLEGRTVRMKRAQMGSERNFDLVSRKPIVHNGQEIDFATLYGMWEDIGKAVYFLTSEATEESDGLTAKQREGLAIVGKVGIQLGTLFGIDRILTPVDILELRRICTIIDSVLEEPLKHESPETLISNLETYFDKGADWESEWAKKLSYEIKIGWFISYKETNEASGERPEDFLDHFRGWLRERIQEYIEEQRDEDTGEA